jgi:hypothetical protein
VKDLTPLQDLRLRNFSCANTEVTDLTPLKNAPLEELHCAADLARRYAAILKAIPSLKSINGQPVTEALKDSPPK